MRSFDLERAGDWDFLAGVDEAGRGALAGPVVAAAVFVRRDFYGSAACRRLLSLVNDSKQLRVEEREAAFARIDAAGGGENLLFATGTGSVEEIAEANILGATRLAMRRAVETVLWQHGLSGRVDFWAEARELLDRPAKQVPRVRLLVDGRPLKAFPYLHTGVVRGDGKSLAIAMASILAKVTRDRKMVELDGRYPGFGLARHKGYGTREHCDALGRLGPKPIHRRRFLRKLDLESAAP